MTAPSTPGVPRSTRLRAYLTAGVVSIALGGVGMRAWAVQVDEGARYRALAERQQEIHLAIPAPRGEIVDAHGHPLAVSADADSIWANPHDVHDVAATAAALARLVDADPRVLEDKLGGDHRFVWIARHVTPDVARAVRDAHLAGVEVAREPRRWYPARALAGPVIGRADIDGNGVDGIELSLNRLLTGKRGEAVAIRDARGHAVLPDGLAPASPGATVHLTIDRNLQEIAETALDAAVTQDHAKDGIVVILDVATGHVLAMASSPGYDPNGSPPRGARDRAVTDAFEAGSVMKVFSVASALDAGVVTPDTEFQIGGRFVVGGHAIHDVELDPYLTVAGIVKRSSNVGAAKIALQLGRDKLYAGLQRFGFGARTGIELPGEQVGMLRDPSRWRDIDLAHMAFGYGLTVTPIQIAAALAAIGNHGVYHPPRIVDEVVDGDGNVLYRPSAPARQVVSAKTADEMLDILATVFDKGKFNGTASTIDVPGFKCAGKTGTARKYDPQTHHYSESHYLGSFAGLAPYHHPRLVILAMIDDPSDGHYYGATVAGPVFAAVASQALRYLGVPGDAPIPPAPASPAAHEATATAAAAATAPAADLEPDIPALAYEVPDFTGLGLARALDLARENHLSVDVTGTGRVVSQDPPAGPAGAQVRVTLHLSDDARAAAPRP